MRYLIGLLAPGAGASAVIAQSAAEALAMLADADARNLTVRHIRDETGADVESSQLRQRAAQELAGDA